MSRSSPKIASTQSSAQLRLVTLVTLRSASGFGQLAWLLSYQVAALWNVLRARIDWTTVGGGNRFDGGYSERAHYSDYQDRNPDRSFHGFSP